MRKDFGVKPWFYPLPVLIIGEIMNINADESILDANGDIDITKLRPISYEPVHNRDYVIGEKVRQAFRNWNVQK